MIRKAILTLGGTFLVLLLVAALCAPAVATLSPHDGPGQAITGEFTAPAAVWNAEMTFSGANTTDERCFNSEEEALCELGDVMEGASVQVVATTTASVTPDNEAICFVTGFLDESEAIGSFRSWFCG